MTSTIASTHESEPVASSPRVASENFTLVREEPVTRPWSALVCGLEDDRTLLIVDWLLLACREAGLFGHALTVNDQGLYGMFVEIAADEYAVKDFGEAPWGAVDLVVSGEHLELLRAVSLGYVDSQNTTVISSCSRRFTESERLMSPSFIVSEREIDLATKANAFAYYAFDGYEVAQWYKLPPIAQAGLLLGAIQGSETTGLKEADFESAIADLGIDSGMYLEAFRRGIRLGRREGGRVRKVKTSYQFTRKRRALVDRHSRIKFEELAERAEKLVAKCHVPALQEAIFLLCQFQDAEWAERMLNQLEDILQQERELLGFGPDPQQSVAGEVIRALSDLMVWPDAAWIANRKINPSRLKRLRSSSGLKQQIAYEINDYIPLTELDREGVRGPRNNKLRASFGVGKNSSLPALLQPLQVEQVNTTTLRGALQLRRMSRSARYREGSPRQRLEIDSLEMWLQTLHDALRVDHQLAKIVAASGTLVQGAGAVREANRTTAHTFWGRVVRQVIAVDRYAQSTDARAAQMVIPYVWKELCRSGALALWEYAEQILGISMAHARGVSYEDTLKCFERMCASTSGD